MKKRVVGLLLCLFMCLYVVAYAATPEAEMMSAQQQKAASWIDTMLVKNKPTDALKLMSSEAQKEISEKKIIELTKKMTQNFGKFKGARFISWTALDQFQMLYLMSFEKEPVVRCVFFFNEKGEMMNFAMQAIKQKENTSKEQNESK